MQPCLYLESDPESELQSNIFFKVRSSSQDDSESYHTQKSKLIEIEDLDESQETDPD